MVELEEVDLAKALAMLSKMLARTAADIMIELDSPDRNRELADALEEAARLLRERAGHPAQGHRLRAANRLGDVARWTRQTRGMLTD